MFSTRWVVTDVSLWPFQKQSLQVLGCWGCRRTVLSNSRMARCWRQFTSSLTCVKKVSWNHKLCGVGCHVERQIWNHASIKTFGNSCRNLVLHWPKFQLTITLRWDFSISVAAKEGVSQKPWSSLWAPSSSLSREEFTVLETEAGRLWCAAAFLLLLLRPGLLCKHCQHCRHWSVSEDFHWQNSAASLWQSSTHWLLSLASVSPLRSLWVSVFSRGEKKGLRKPIYQPIRHCHQPKQNLAKHRRKSRRNGSLRKGYRASIFDALLIVPFLCPFSYRFPLLKDTLWQALWFL